MTPSGWCATTVRQVAEVAIGKTPARNEKSYWDREKTTQNRWATIADIKRKFIGETSEHISDLGVQRSNARLVPPGTLLMSFKLTLGRAAITSRSMYTNEAIAAFYPNGLADTEYLYYLFPTLALEKLSDRAVKGRTLNKAKLRALRLALPPLTEQRKIAAILSSVDDAIEKTQAVIDQVQVVKRGLMQELLTRGLPGRHTRFKQTEIGEIPEEWRTVSLAECGAGVTSGSRGWAKYYSDDGALFLRITNLARGSIRLQLGDTKHVTLPQRSAEAIRTRVQPRDLVISITADLGMVGVIPEDIGEAYVNQHVALVRFCSHEMRSEFAGYFLTTDVARNRFQRLNDSGAKAGLNLATIKNMTVPQPPCAEQDLIVKILSTMEDRLAGEVRTLDGLAAAKSALMSVLLTGELRVTPDPEVA